MRLTLGCIRKADKQFGLIGEGDHVAVGLSGGKDSLLLTKALAMYRKFSPNRFTMEAITLDMGFDGFDPSPLSGFCQELDVPFTCKKTDIKEVVFDIRQEKNPCALCAKFRRGALNELAKAHGANKVALGHHREDVLETLLLSLFFEARLHVFTPSAYLSKAGVTVIRPMVFLPEKHVISCAKKFELPICKNPCPANGYTKRQDMKELLKYFDGIVPDGDAANRMMTALSNTKEYQLWD